MPLQARPQCSIAEAFSCRPPHVLINTLANQNVWLKSSNSKSSKVAHFGDSQISEEVIHHWDGAFAVPSGWFAGGVRDLSGPPEGAPRQHCDGGFRAFGVRPVFYAKRIVS